MTITSEVQKTSNLPGDGSNFSFDFSPLVIYTSTDIEVFHVVTATGVETEVSAGTGATNYSLTVASFPGTGTITYPANQGTAIPSTEAMVIKKVLPLTQTTDLGNQGAYLPEVLEQRLDRLVGMMIQQQEELDRCLKIPITDATITNTEINTDAVRTATHTVQVDSTGTTFITAAQSSTTGSASSSTPANISISSGAAGSGTDFSRDDHVHLLPTTVPRLATENTFTETQIWFKGSDVTSASPLVLGAGNWFDVTAGNAITSITSIGIGTMVLLQFDAALTLTHNATNLILPGGVDIVTQAGDIAMFYEYASADWRLISYIHGTATNGRMPGPDFESSETSLNNDAQITFAHGLGSAPSKVEVVLRANTATATGWADNEEMIFSGSQTGAVANDGFDVTADATNVYITQANAIQLLDHTAFTHEDITQTEYDWVVRAWV